MKASIITLHSVCNYGTQLQAYATQEKMKEYFDKVCFVNYRRPNTYGVRLLKTFSRNNPIKMLAILPTLLAWKKVFGRFQKKYLNISPNTKNYLDDKSDIYFSGSDQVWNTGWNEGVIPEFYLSFVPDCIPKCSYSSSFGMDKINKSDKDVVKNYLSRFLRISVREQSACKILQEIGINDAIQIIDPSLVLNADFWRKKAPESKIGKDYILIYCLNRNKDLDNYAKRMAEKTGKKLYRLCTRYDQFFRSGKSILIPEILEFVTLIDNASYVITDSFHATAFSINMNTIPVVFYPNKYSSRLRDILQLTGLEVCHPADYNDFDIIRRNISFAKSEEVLERERKKADQYLREVKMMLEGKREGAD